ncbi:MAG: MFS transporter [Spirochaetaceae bacterium]
MNALRLYYFFVFAMYAVVIPHYQIFLRATGYTPASVGLMIGFFEIFGVIGPILLGGLADRTGRFREIKVATILLGAVTIAFLLADPPFPLALFLSALTGFLFKVSVPLTDAVAGSVLADPREQYGQVRVFGSIGFAAAAVAVPAFSLLDDSDPYSIMIAFLVSMALFAAVVLLIPPPSPLEEGEKPETNRVAATATPNGPTAPAAPSAGTAETVTAGNGDLPLLFWLVIAAISVGNIAFGAYNSFFSLYLKEELEVRAVTLFWAIGAVSEIPIIFYSGKLIRRFGIGILLTASAFIMSARLLLYGLAPTAALVVLIQALHAVTFGVMLSAGVAYVNQTAPRRTRGTAMAAFDALGIGLAVFVGSTVGGYLVEAIGYTGMFSALAIAPAVSGVMLLLLTRRKESGLGVSKPLR